MKDQKLIGLLGEIQTGNLRNTTGIVTDLPDFLLRQFADAHT